ncbi:MAG: hypothetical protein ABSD74_02315 [Rhizomicrobium sp.]|jgi:hypothetical protein
MSNSTTRAHAQKLSHVRSSNLLRGALLAVPVLGAVYYPQAADACACGCGIFDVGANVLAGMPTEADGSVSVWFRYSYMNQNQNWEGNAKAPASDNGDKEINTSFYTVGGEYRISSDWTVMAELPVYDRSLTTTDDGQGSVTGVPNSVYTGRIVALGDLQLTGMYTGISNDMSSGLTFGVKLPTGDYTGPTGPAGGTEFDRDSLPGTGSTDLMFGGYHVGQFAPDSLFGYFVQARYQFAVLTSSNVDGSYRPGNELDGAAGVTYDFGPRGPFADVLPLLQILSSWRDHDTGTGADPLNSGYRRVLIAPGIQVRLNNLRFYADVAKPIYQDTNSASSLAEEGTAGQLVAGTLYKLQVSYDF